MKAPVICVLFLTISNNLPMTKKITKGLLFLFLCVASRAATYYVARNGNDANPGTKTLPLLTIQKAQTLVLPGDTVYVRGGTYAMQESQIASYARIQAYVILLD